MSPTKTELMRLGEAHPLLAKILESHPPDKDDLGLQDRKAMAEELLAAVRATLGEPGAGIKKTPLFYRGSDGTEMRAFLFQPDPLPADGAPVAMIIHGGGFAVGGPEFEEMTCRQLVREFGMICYSISYRLAPEHKFPAAPTDAWSALQFVAANAESWGADPRKGFIVGGTSAGGNLAAGLAHVARDNDLRPPLTGQWLACPWLCPQGGMPDKYAEILCSYDQCREAPALNQSSIDMYTEALQPDPKDDRFNVFCHSKGHSGLPPAYIQVCGMDPFRDEGILYEECLRTEGGVRTKMDVYSGLPHGFWLFFPTLTDSIARYREDLSGGFRWLLRGTNDES